MNQVVVQGVEQRRLAAGVGLGTVNWQEAHGVRLQRSAPAAFRAGWAVREGL